MSFGLQEGTIFGGRYQVIGCIAAGGMGAVYEVLHLETERRRALKVMLPQMLQSLELRDRFKREARVAAKVDSEFIVDVFDAGIDDTTQMPFLVMELLKGEELGKRLARQGRFSAPEVLTYLKQTALALDKTHQASIVHRDLKPENLFLTYREDGQPRIKVLDFGVAKIIAESGTMAAGTRSLGTPLYMSPEQFNPQARLTAAADIYALGMMAYTLLVGAPYWAEEAKTGNLVTFATTAVHGPPERASLRAAAHGVTLPPSFDAWFSRVTAKDPAHRYPTAGVAVAALAEAFGLPSSRASFPSLEQIGPMPVLAGGSGISQSGISQSGLRAVPVLTAGAPTPLGASPHGVAPQRGRGPMIAAVAALGFAMVGVGAFVLLRSPPAPESVPVAADSAAAAVTAATGAVIPMPASAAPVSASPLEALPVATATTSESVTSTTGVQAASRTGTNVGVAARTRSAKDPAKPLLKAGPKMGTDETYSQD